MPTSVLSLTYLPLDVRRRSSAFSASVLDELGERPDERAARDLELDPDDLRAGELVRSRRARGRSSPDVDDAVSVAGPSAPFGSGSPGASSSLTRAFARSVPASSAPSSPTATSRRTPVTAAIAPVAAGGRRTTRAWSGSSTTHGVARERRAVGRLHADGRDLRGDVERDALHDPGVGALVERVRVLHRVGRDRQREREDALGRRVDGAGRALGEGDDIPLEQLSPTRRARARRARRRAASRSPARRLPPSRPRR